MDVWRHTDVYVCVCVCHDARRRGGVSTPRRRVGSCRRRRVFPRAAPRPGNAESESVSSRAVEERTTRDDGAAASRRRRDFPRRATVWHVARASRLRRGARVARPRDEAVACLRVPTKRDGGRPASSVPSSGTTIASSQRRVTVERAPTDFLPRRAARAATPSRATAPTAARRCALVSRGGSRSAFDSYS